MKLYSLALIAGAMSVTVSAHATNLIKNADFSLTTPGAAHSRTDSTSGDTVLTNGSTYLTDWTVGNDATKADQVWVYPNGSPDITVHSSGWNTGWSIYGPANGHNNGYANPVGSKVILELDGGADYRGSLFQTISGLTPGDKYNYTFQWAGGQQTCCGGNTTESLQVSLGSQTQTTSVWHNPAAGFSGWMNETMTFTATSASETLYLLAVGTPSGEPPVVLLNGAGDFSAASAVPEPAAWAMMIVGIGGLGALARRRRALAALPA